MWFYQQPVKLYFGAGQVGQLSEILEQGGYQKGVLVSDPFLVKNGLAQRIVEMSKGKIGAVFSELQPNPTTVNVDACAAILVEQKADFVVALGGGSAMDCTKAAASVACLGKSVTEFHATGVALPPVHIPMIAIPTTAGTGAEVTCAAVISNHEKGFKAPIVSDNFYPALAIVDPELTYTVPRRVTVDTGLDVMSHAIEGFMSINHQPICDAIAVHAAQLVFQYLEAACSDEVDVVAKEKMCEASLMAGLAFSIPKTGASHACSFILTNQYGIPHGAACGLTLDYFVRINKDAEGGRLHDFAKKLGFADCDALCDALLDLKKRIGGRIDLKDLNLTQEDLEKLVTGSHHPNMNNSPVTITDEMLRDMYTGFIF